MRRVLAAIAGAAVLAGCPIPQAVPDYPPGTITPPRILVDEMDGNGTTVHFVPANCPTTAEPLYPLGAKVLHTNTIENIEARWFVNYDTRYELDYEPRDVALVPADADPTILTRRIPDFVFRPYQYPPAPGTGSVTWPPPFPDPGLVRVVELVVSNGFDPAATTTAYQLPNRTPRLGFETQLYRWVFVSVAPAASCPDGGPCCP